MTLQVAVSSLRGVARRIDSRCSAGPQASENRPSQEVAGEKS